MVVDACACVLLGGRPRLGLARLVLGARDGRLVGALVAGGWLEVLAPRDGLAEAPLETEEAVGASNDEEMLAGLVSFGFEVVVSVLLVETEGCFAAEAVVGFVSLDVTAAERTGALAAGFLGCSAALGAAFAAEVARVGAAKDRAGALVEAAETLRGSGAGVEVSTAVSELAVCSVCSSVMGACSGTAGATSVVSRIDSSLILGRDVLGSPLVSRCSPIRPSFSTATKLVRTLESGLGPSDVVDEAPAANKTKQPVSL